jgi:Histidine kinase-, DNA gyrase B-, and HSP90-like ATPase
MRPSETRLAECQPGFRGSLKKLLDPFSAPRQSGGASAKHRSLLRRVSSIIRPVASTVRNAVQATGDGHFSGYLEIVVTDAGAGISPENQKKLFKEVVQFNPEKLQGGGGSGFGLFITKGIVDLHKGQISVFSEGEGKDTSFTLKLPMTRPSDDVTVSNRQHVAVAAPISDVPMRTSPGRNANEVRPAHGTNDMPSQMPTRGTARRGAGFEQERFVCEGSQIARSSKVPDVSARIGSGYSMLRSLISEVRDAASHNRASREASEYRAVSVAVSRNRSRQNSVYFR